MPFNAEEEKRKSEEAAKAARIAKQKPSLRKKVLEHPGLCALQELLEAEKESHDPRIQFNISEYYWDKADYKNSFEWAKKSAEQNYPDGMARFGWHFFDGKGIDKDEAKGMELIQNAVNNDSVCGQNLFGIMYDNGRGMTQDDAKAVEWYTKAAEQGYARAQWRLGNMYSLALVMTPDYAKAFEWYAKASKQGEGDAQKIIGLKDPGSRRKVVKKFLKAAADQGSALAKHILKEHFTIFGWKA